MYKPYWLFLFNFPGLVSIPCAGGYYAGTRQCDFSLDFFLNLFLVIVFSVFISVFNFYSDFNYLKNKIKIHRCVTGCPFPFKY